MLNPAFLAQCNAAFVRHSDRRIEDVPRPGDSGFPAWEAFLEEICYLFTKHGSDCYGLSPAGPRVLPSSGKYRKENLP